MNSRKNIVNDEFFLDTNVIIDVLANRQPFATASAKLFDYAEKGKIKLFIAALSYSNIYYVLRKTTSHDEMIFLLQDIEAISETMDVTNYIISQSLRTTFRDFEDAIQYHTALSNKNIEAIVTRNVKDYQNSQLPVLAPDKAIILIEDSLL